MAGTPTLDEMKQAFLVTLRGLQEKEQQLTEKEEQLRLQAEQLTEERQQLAAKKQEADNNNEQEQSRLEEKQRQLAESEQNLVTAQSTADLLFGVKDGESLHERLCRLELTSTEAKKLRNDYNKLKFDHALLTQAPASQQKRRKLKRRNSFCPPTPHLTSASTSTGRQDRALPDMDLFGLNTSEPLSAGNGWMHNTNVNASKSKSPISPDDRSTFNTPATSSAPTVNTPATSSALSVNKGSTVPGTPEIIDLSSDTVTPPRAMPAITKGRDWRAATASELVKSINDIVERLTILDPITNTTIPASEAGLTFPETAFTAFRDLKGFATFQQGVAKPRCLTKKARKSQPQEVKAGITEACNHCVFYGEVCVYIEKKVDKEIIRVILPVPEEYPQGASNASDVRMYIAPGQHQTR